MKRIHFLIILLCTLLLITLPALVACKDDAPSDENIVPDDKTDTEQESEGKEEGEPTSDGPVYYTVYLEKNIDAAGTATGNGEYEEGQRVGLYATARDGYEWVGWYEGETKISSEKSFDFPMPPTDKTFTARWKLEQHTVTIVSDPVGTGTLTGGGDYNKGASVTIGATPQAGYFLIGLYDEGGEKVNADDETYTFSMESENRSFVAKFERVLTRVNQSGEEDADGEYILFGSYPQTYVASDNRDLRDYLMETAGDLPTAEDSRNWTSYKYYSENSTDFDYMWYIDLDYGGERYRGVYLHVDSIPAYRPHVTGGSVYAYSTGHGGENEYFGYDYVHWFKFEPLKWRILSEENGEALILCESIIDSQQFCAYKDPDERYPIEHNGGTAYPNSYEYSDIRKWLNETFYNTAFNDLRQQLILITTVDNSARSTNTSEDATALNDGENIYTCDNTEDKVFLLSNQEATDSVYGFDTDPGVCDPARMKQTTDYARCQGAETHRANDEYKGYGEWWLRSPFYTKSPYISAMYFNYDGRERDEWSFWAQRVDATICGIVPALRIRL